MTALVSGGRDPSTRTPACCSFTNRTHMQDWRRLQCGIASPDDQKPKKRAWKTSKKQRKRMAKHRVFNHLFLADGGAGADRDKKRVFFVKQGLRACADSRPPSCGVLHALARIHDDDASTKKTVQNSQAHKSRPSCQPEAHSSESHNCEL